MEGLTPDPQCLQLAGKVEWQAVEAAVVPLGWEQTPMYSVVREAAAAAGQLKQQQEVKAVVGEEVAWVEV